MTDSTRTRFLGLDFDPLNLEEAVSHIVARASDGSTFGYVVTPNVDHVVRLDHEPELAPLYETAALTLCDSRILELLARVRGLHLPAAPGADIVEMLVRREIAPHEPVTVIGGDADMVRQMKARFGLTDIRWHDAPMGLRRNPEAVEAAAGFAAQQNARFVFLCVGSPQQEMIAQAIVRRGDARGVGLCCGASFDFLTGKTARAPVWMRRARLEWLHRLASEPKRLARRYLVDGPRILGLWLRTA